MQPIYLEDEIVDPRRRAEAFDTSGVPVPPPISGFQMLGEVQGSAFNNAYLAEENARRIDQMTEKERAEAEQAAIRFAGQQKYQQLIAGGAKPAEALRLAGPELFYNNPNALIASVRATREVTPFEPSVVERGGTKFAVTGPNRAEVIKPERVPDPKMPQANVDQRKMLDQEIRNLSSQLAELQPKVGDKTELALNPKLPAQVADIAARLQTAKDQYLNFGTNWMGATAAAPVKTLTRDLAAKFLRDAGGNKDAARKLARDAGYAL